MTHEGLDSLDKETLIRLILTQAETIAALTRQCETLLARVAELEAKLGLPPKTPDNSSTPPSKGQKPSATAKAKSDGRRKSHAGAHRPLHPNPTSSRDIAARACQHCGADVSQRPQLACETYDHIEIPLIKPEVTRVTLYGGVCPCCAKKFKAPPPADMPKGSPFGENLRALVIYLRFTQGIAFERLATLLSDILGLEISEGALVNMLDASRDAFAAQRSAIRARLLSGTALQSDETGLRVGKSNWWLWVFHHGDSAVFVAEPSRAKKVVEDFLGDFRPDYWVSDRYGGQLGWANKENQVCLGDYREFRARSASSVGAGLSHRATTRAIIRCYAENLRQPARGASRRTHGARANACSRREIAKHDQANAPTSLRVRDQPRTAGDQQRLRTRVAALRGVPQNHQRLSHGVGRETLC